MSSAPPIPVPTRPRRGLLLALAGVLAAHLWLLGGLPWPSVHIFPAAPPVTMHTRVLPPPVASTPVAPPPAARAQPLPHLAPSPQTATTAPSADLDAFVPAPPTDTAQTATKSIAPQPPTPEPEPPTAAPESPAQYLVPPPVQLNYDVAYASADQRQVASAELLWQHDGTDYQAHLRVTKFLILVRQWTSRGALTADGLEPQRFGDKGFRRSEAAAHFVREAGKVVFSANTPEVPLLTGAQDHLSVFVQLASLWAGAPRRWVAGDSISFQSIGARQSETWTFVVSPEESITVPGGTLQAIKLTREPTGEYSTRAELWLAPQLAYLPAHIRLTEGRNNVLDMVWTASQAP